MNQHREMKLDQYLDHMEQYEASKTREQIKAHVMEQFELHTYAPALLFPGQRVVRGKVVHIETIMVERPPECKTGMK